ncbi:uncharacterized protein LOC130828524 [Amaranthus tricolor]|uniref:uncharacterized protein LOC130828524 n=1 Tax=Amaranthus tricolor TaxID=29722 RepID=UPI002587E458|nr:uncharacterized protein LOC130828524 [Amaranthus tricolor]
MFLGDVARPRWNRFGQCTFDGKIGIFPFINMVAAQRDSKNRPRGSIEIKPTELVIQEVNRSMLIQQLIPAILGKWPSEGPSIILIQQDNARVHITNDDPIWQQHNRQGGLTFILTQQPPNSPDCNILDLGFFRSIQSLMHKKMPKNITEIIIAVEDAFGELHPKTLSNVWISLQHHLSEILKVKGSNDYIQPHFGKKVEEDNGRLRIQGLATNTSITEIEDAAQTTEIIQEAYDQAVEETQR